MAVRRSRREDSVTRTRRRSASCRSWRSDPPAGAAELGGRWQRHPPSHERRYCAGGAAASRISRAAQVALKHQQKMAPVSHTYWESRLPLTLSLSDSETKIFCRLARQRRAPQYKQTRRLLTNRPVLKLCRGESYSKGRLRVSDGLCKDSMMMQSAEPSNSDF